MQPAARLSAAIEILDIYLSGIAAEKALTNWARRSRFAGSKDRAAIRDIVFDCLRQRKSYAAISGVETGRGLVIAHVRKANAVEAVAQLFTGEGHAPAALTSSERDAITEMAVSDSWEALHDLPAWLSADLEASLGSDLTSVSAAMRRRAPVFVRVNIRKANRADVQAELSVAGIETKPCLEVKTGLEVTANARQIVPSAAYLEGRIELQDANSQAICEGLPAALRMLDFCAGGGGKVLAYGALHNAKLFAHDVHAARLKDALPRARRAGCDISILTAAQCEAHGPFDLVVCDVPCSGTGAWRRSPEGKWSLTEQQLGDLLITQRQILEKAKSLVTPNGTLVYITCSILERENTQQIQRFLSDNSEFEITFEKQFLPKDGGDGFYVAHLTHAPHAP